VSSNWFAPPPGSRSGVADYAATLRPALERLGEWSVPLYHLGNNRLHEAIYRRALEEPGVVVLHDAVLHHFLLGTLPRDRYIEEFVFNYGEWRRPQAEELWDERATSGVDPRYFDFPLLKRIVERARAVVVHNPGAAEVATAHGAKNVHVIPHFFDLRDAAPDRADTARFRESLGIGQGVALFGIFGYLRETKRVIPCIEAFRRLHAVREDTALLLAGDAVSADLKRSLDTAAGHPAIHRLPHLSERDFLIAAAALDCCLNLRHPGAGETSGIAVRMMGIGKPVVVTAGAENAAIPTTACLRVTPGVAEAAELFDHMVLVAAFPAVAREIGDHARRHIRERHALETVASQYWQILCAASS
jgi:glycosyltransferase involved in cell wall biosynthesis